MDGRNRQHKAKPPKAITQKNTEIAKISVRDKDLLRKYYTRAFKKLNYRNCCFIAKAYIKLVEPCKQKKFPYSGRIWFNGRRQQLHSSKTSPPWWPSGLSHNPPDKLERKDVIILLICLLCDLHKTHQITVQKLKEADQTIHRLIGPRKQVILDEIYRVRQEEENYIDKKTGKPFSSAYGVDFLHKSHTDFISDGEALVTISRKHLPSPSKSSESSEKIGQAFAEQHNEGEATPSQVAPAQGIHTQKSSVSLDCQSTSNMPSFPIIPASTVFSDAAFRGAEQSITHAYFQPGYLYQQSIEATILSGMAPFGGTVDPNTLDYSFKDQCQ
ncbi:hypothetical protein N7470_000584 [Penicillium chermesinum]|nr:hypothetical protein N7470_000584 [Penicillium chermesinum]